MPAMEAEAPRRRVRVLTLVDHIALIGGAELLAVQIAAGLDPVRFESWLCTTRSPTEGDPGVDAAVAVLRAAGVRCVFLGRRSKLDAWRLAALVRLLRRERIDVLHAHMFGSNAWGAVLGRLAGVPVVIAHEHSRNDPYGDDRLRRLVDRHVIARLSDKFIAVSRADQRYMIEAERIAPAKTTYVPNGAPDPAAGTGGDGRTLLGVEPSTPTVGSVGFMHPVKRFDLLVRAAAVVRREFPGLRVFIVGDGRERPSLERLITELGLEDTVKLLGRRSDVPDLLQAFDVAVCCSDHEGTSVAVLECMAAGLPIVATRSGGQPDLIEDGEHGLLVEPGDAASLADAIARLLRDRDLASRLGRAAAERRAREFTLQMMCDRIEGIYGDLLARGASRTAEQPIR